MTPMALTDLFFVADEAVQAYGGYGFSAEYPPEKALRDCRINRIFEGTNEINRMLVPGMIMKKALKGELAFLQAARAVAEEVTGMPSFVDPHEPGFLEAEAQQVAGMKKVILATLGIAAQKFGMSLKDQQGVLSDVADITIETFACESALLRAQKKAARDGEAAAEPMADMVRLYVNDAMERVATLGRNVLGAACQGDELRVMLAGLRRLAKHDAINRTVLHDRIAQRAIDAEGYTVG